MVEYFTGVNLIQWASGCYGMKLTSGSGYLNVRFRPKADVHNHCYNLSPHTFLCEHEKSEGVDIELHLAAHIGR